MDEQRAGLEYLLRESAAGRCFAPENLSEEQRQLGKTAEKFAREEVLPGRRSACSPTRRMPPRRTRSDRVRARTHA